MSNITKNAIVLSFKELAKEKDIAGITVVEITDKCGLKRQTFYNHFKDKYEIIKWMYKNEVIDKIDTEEFDWEQKFKIMFEYFVENKKIILNIYNSENQHYILNFVLKQSKPMIKKVVEEKSRRLAISNMDKDLLTIFYAGALGSILINWIEAGMPDLIDEIVSKTGKILSGNIESYFNNLT